MCSRSFYADLLLILISSGYCSHFLAFPSFMYYLRSSYTSLLSLYQYMNLCNSCRSWFIGIFMWALSVAALPLLPFLWNYCGFSSGRIFLLPEAQNFLLNHREWIALKKCLSRFSLAKVTKMTCWDWEQGQSCSKAMLNSYGWLLLQTDHNSLKCFLYFMRWV